MFNRGLDVSSVYVQEGGAVGSSQLFQLPREAIVLYGVERAERAEQAGIIGSSQVFELAQAVSVLVDADAFQGGAIGSSKLSQRLRDSSSSSSSVS